MNKKIGIHAVLERHNDLTRRMTEDARYGLTSLGLGEADDEELNLDEPTPDFEPGTEEEPDLNLDNQEQTPPEGEEDLDLDALIGDEPQDQPDGQPLPTEELPTTTPEPQLTPETPSTGGADEELDVTGFIQKSEDITNKVDSQVQSMTKQIEDLTTKLQSMDQLIGKIQQVEDQIQSMKPQRPIETLKLRSLDSYPYSQGIDDYWKKKEVEIEKLRDFNRVGENNEYVLTQDDVDNYSDVSIRNSLNPDKEQQSNFDLQKSDNQNMGRFNNLS